MKSLMFKEDFDFFQKEYELSREIIHEVYIYPTKTENYSLTKNLYYKNINNKHLILCVKRRGLFDIFSFCFWIPEDIFNTHYTLNNIFISFIDRFGSVINSINGEAKYINITNVLPLSQAEILEVQNGKLESLNKFIKIKSEKHTPHYLGFNIVLSDRGIELSNLFAINNFKYIAWIKNVEFKTVIVNIDWLNRLNDIVYNINPSERTKLEIKTVSKKYLLYKSMPEVKQKVNFSYPKLYERQFEVIVNSIEEGGNVEVLFPILEDKKKCIFCGDTTVTKEHIFPKWFKNYFPEQIFENVSGPFTYDDPVGSITKGVTGGQESSYGITSRNVCKTCNNGWMSKLEKEIKGIITKDSTTLNKSISELNLTESKSFTFSKWLICKSLLLSIRNNTTLPLPDNIFSSLKDDRTHKGFIVEVLPTNSYGLNYMTQFGASFQGGQKLLKDYFNEATFLFVSIIHIGNFLYRVSYWEHDERLLRASLRLPTTTLLPYKYELPFPKGDSFLNFDQFEGNNLIFVFAESLSLIENHPSSFVP